MAEQLHLAVKSIDTKRKTHDRICEYAMVMKPNGNGEFCDYVQNVMRVEML